MNVKILLLFTYILFIAGCHSHRNEKNNVDATPAQHENDDHEHEGHDHGDENDDHEHEGHDLIVGDNHEGHDNEENHEGHDHTTESSGHEGHNHDIIESNNQLHDEDHGLVKLKLQPFAKIIKTSGELLPAKGDEVVISAKHSGIIQLNGKQLFDGKSIRKGERLLTVSGKEMSDNSLKVKYLSAKAEFEQAKANYERALKLKTDTIISETEFLNTELAYKTSKSKYDAIQHNYEKGGQHVLSTASGYLKKLLVTDGQYIEAGEPLVIVSRNQRLVLKAELSQKHIAEVSGIHCANFKPSYTTKVYDTHDLNGKVISYGKTTSDNSFYTPLFIEIDNVTGLVPGSYVEVYLRLHEDNEAIAVPKTAILEEQGSFFVFVKENDDYVKHYIQIGGNNGKQVEVTSGLKPGEIVATKEVYRIKLAKAGTAIPHGHSH